MDLQQVQRQIRSTDVEQVLLLAHAEGGQAKPSQIKEEISDESGGFATAEASQQLRDLGLARQETSLAGEVTLTGDGKRLAERIQQSRL
ncbi:MAG TPA: hypothetical protein VFL99_09040, partial [Segeticoccus sp.]|uniref:hypothetical protein n=1 Tax=Segeticoccus sp. TaxID=2706531 RepID=UPI002D7F21AA